MINTSTAQTAADAPDVNGLPKETTGNAFLNTAAIKQAHKGKAEISRLTQAGHAVQKGSVRDFTVCKYGMSKYSQDVEELQAFSRKVGLSK